MKLLFQAAETNLTQRVPNETYGRFINENFLVTAGCDSRKCILISM